MEKAWGGTHNSSYGFFDVYRNALEILRQFNEKKITEDQMRTKIDEILALDKGTAEAITLAKQFSAETLAKQKRKSDEYSNYSVLVNYGQNFNENRRN